MSLKLTILGCANSAGVPAIGNFWGACDPNEPRNRRLRPCAAVRSDYTTIIIDTGPDFREQVNRARISDIDAVLFSHAHGDHVHGIDELRVVRNRTKKLVPIYGTQETLTELQYRFDYLFIERHGGLYPKVLDPNLIDRSQFNLPITVGDITFIPFEQEHGTCKSLGFRFGDIAYSTDMIDLDQQALEVLRGVKVWVVDGAAYNMTGNKVHATLKQVYALNDVVQAEKVYLTHLPPFMDYRTLLNELPEGYEPAYDGLEIRSAGGC